MAVVTRAAPRSYDESTPLFDPARLARRSDPGTSKQAAALVLPKLGRIHREVMASYRELGAMSARQCEQLERFGDYSPSTIRRRITDLHRHGKLVADGTETESGKSPCTVYRVAS